MVIKMKVPGFESLGFAPDYLKLLQRGRLRN